MNKDSQFIWLDGELVPYEDAKIHVLSHTLHYGTGVFEGMRAYATHDNRTAIFRATEHWQRFLDSLRALGLTTKMTLQALSAGAIECIRRNEFKECYVRPIAFLDDAFRGLKLPSQPKAIVAIATWPWGKYLGDDGQQKGIRVKIASLRRADPSSSLPLAKITGAYLTSVLCRKEATECGFDEALLLDPQGFVAEGSGENIFIVKNGALITPPTDYILPGITRQSVIEMAKDLQIPVHADRITRNELYLAEEAFFTGTAVEVTPIRQVDQQVIGTGKPGPITQKLFDLFFRIARGKEAAYQKWLTWV